MNRFEQKSMSFGRKLVYLLPILAFLVLFVLFVQGIGSVSESTLTKQQESLETALGRSISQCYAVEGCYPPSLEYLEQHYGLLYDKNSFFVDYEYYGSNLLVKRMLNMLFDCNNDCLIHLITDHLTGTRFSQISFHDFMSPFFDIPATSSVSKRPSLRLPSASE